MNEFIKVTNWDAEKMKDLALRLEMSYRQVYKWYWRQITISRLGSNPAHPFEAVLWKDPTGRKPRYKKKEIHYTNADLASLSNYSEASISSSEESIIDKFLQVRENQSEIGAQLNGLSESPQKSEMYDSSEASASPLQS